MIPKEFIPPYPGAWKRITKDLRAILNLPEKIVNPDDAISETSLEEYLRTFGIELMPDWEWHPLLDVHELANRWEVTRAEARERTRWSLLRFQRIWIMKGGRPDAARPVMALVRDTKLHLFANVFREFIILFWIHTDHQDRAVDLKELVP